MGYSVTVVSISARPVLSLALFQMSGEIKKYYTHCFLNSLYVSMA